MSEYNKDHDFEKSIVETFAVPTISEEFVNSQYKSIVRKNKMKETKGFFSKPIMLRFSTATLALLMGATLIIGPQKVYAAIMQLFGYIPGVGVVSEDTDIRILEEPVNVTREGITVSVNSMVLTSNESIIDFGTMGVPSSASANVGEGEGCMDMPYLLLDDGTQIDVLGREAVPADVWDATFVMPCIMGADSAKTPTDWQIPLTFVPAPGDYEVLPVQDVSAAENETAQTEESGEGATNLSIEKMIETENGYILVGKLSPASIEDQVQQMGVSGVYDADGKKIVTSYPTDINEYELMEIKLGDMPFAFEFAGYDVAFPIRVEVSGVVVTSHQTDEAVVGETQTWETEWQPETAREFSAPVVSDDLCWHAGSGDAFPQLADQLTGKVVVTRYLDQPEVMIANLQGQSTKTITNASNPAFSADGTHIAYHKEGSIYIQDLESGEESNYEGFKEFSVRDITWAPNGDKIAFVYLLNENSGVYLLDLENGEKTRLTEYGYEYIAGWSSDGNTLYYAITGTNDNRYPLFALDVNSGESTQLFEMENSALRVPYPRVSADGEWVAYRSQDTAGVYVKPMDGGEAHLVAEKMGYGISNFNWSGDWLVLNVFDADDLTKPDVVMINPFTCDIYQVPAIWGDAGDLIVE